jgi:pullulanase/glycogen debranching enzyme
MIENIRSIINNYDSKINVQNIEFSNNVIDIEDLLSLYDLRLNIYKSNAASFRDIKFLNKKIEMLKNLEKLNILKIKMVAVDKYIFYFNENFDKIYLIINKITNDIKFLL